MFVLGGGREQGVYEYGMGLSWFSEGFIAWALALAWYCSMAAGFSDNGMKVAN